MDEEKEKHGIVFSEEDCLHWLQLWTKKTVAERKTERIPAEFTEFDSDESQPTHALPIEFPPNWRLIPENAELYDWQKECLPIWLAQGRGTVKIATGGGKTLFALAAAQRLQNSIEPALRLVIVVPTIPLMFQWYDEIRKGNLPDAAIGLMGAGRQTPNPAELRVLICVLASAREKLPALIQESDWGNRLLLVVDECHRANAQKARQIFESNPKFRLGLSATPEPDDDSGEIPSDEAYKDSVIGKELGPIVYNFSILDCMKAGLLTPFEVWHVGLALTETETALHSRLSREISELRKSLQRRHRQSRSKQGFFAWCQTQASHQGFAATEAERFIGSANRRKRLLYGAESRSEITRNILKATLWDADTRAIIFHESIEQVEDLFFRILEDDLPAVLEHSKLPDTLRYENIDAFRRGIARIIVSAKSLVEGFNVPSADLGIIAASSGSVRQRIQSLGRMLRRKPSGRTARIFVLYIRDTEDEAIYEKADWEEIIGIERNRYFYWATPEAGTSWEKALAEQSKPPRIYRPSSWEIDTGALKNGDPYPGRPDGVSLRVDQAGNLRMEDDSLIPAESSLIKAISERNPYRRANLTPAGHLIVRVDHQGSDAETWIFLDNIQKPEVTETIKNIRLKLKRASGRRQIVYENMGKPGNSPWALGPQQSADPEAGKARDRLLAWIESIETSRSTKLSDLYWDGENGYWIEVQGDKIVFPELLPPLEFIS